MALCYTSFETENLEGIMKRVYAIAAGLLMAACSGDAPSEKTSAPAPEPVIEEPVVTEPEVTELPEFNTYSDEQMAVLSAFGMGSFDNPDIKVQPLRDGLAVMLSLIHI